MREIKLRAWDTQEKKWFEPVYRAYEGKLESLMVGFNGQLFLHTPKGLEHESVFPDRYILNQYAGLKDKDGKDIYEGDIIQYVSEETVGERRVSRGRRGYDTYTVKGDVTIQGVVQWEHFKEGIYSIIPMFVIRTGQNVGYKTYFWTEKKSDLPTSTVSQLTKPLYDGKYKYQIIGNIYENPELLEVSK